ncbi:transcriptional repressor LexA [Solemya velum gill symbiont]|uniref:LexA repressor n=2 Tax=Solemya velum gill symbiont TaxID=2340 RepID=A0A0B0HAK8_SOVGS|nr:transcriptional repressor LexA [Solemya velum gill symbiont]KHF24461.1 SOS regulatory protein LexA [Solemya velum gill symbiont]OOY34948.1 repressor LexA [Solemya velum gill symbiont]OOY37299.1 repressor LexA [Solemya velum gill symbiont]OOY39364.1 repressor LexA [Solemya velum gill symbiont]OOY41266.1 repressor LexA [Solemya velum gill symbiont]
MFDTLTRRQQEIYDFLFNNQEQFEHPPTLSELCTAMGLSSRGSMHKQVQALIEAGLVEPMNNQRRGIRLTASSMQSSGHDSGLPLLGRIAAGQPIEAVSTPETLDVPTWMHTQAPCYVLQVKGDSMIDEGILDGDFVVIEKRSHARNGEIIVALVEGEEATLKRIEQQATSTILHPANASMSPMTYRPDQVEIQGVLVGQMRSYVH